MYLKASIYGQSYYMEFKSFAAVIRKNAAVLLQLVQIAEKEVNCTTYKHMNTDDYIMFTINEQLQGEMISCHYSYRSLGHFFNLCVAHKDKTSAYSEKYQSEFRTFCNKNVAKTIVLTKPDDAIRLIYATYNNFHTHHMMCDPNPKDLRNSL